MTEPGHRESASVESGESLPGRPWRFFTRAEDLLRSSRVTQGATVAVSKSASKHGTSNTPRGTQKHGWGEAATRIAKAHLRPVACAAVLLAVSAALACGPAQHLHLFAQEPRESLAQTSHSESTPSTPPAPDEELLTSAAPASAPLPTTEDTQPPVQSDLNVNWLPFDASPKDRAQSPPASGTGAPGADSMGSAAPPPSGGGGGGMAAAAASAGSEPAPSPAAA